MQAPQRHESVVEPDVTDLILRRELRDPVIGCNAVQALVAEAEDLPDFGIKLFEVVIQLKEPDMEEYR